MRWMVVGTWLLLGLCGCSLESLSPPPEQASYEATENWRRDIVATDLEVSLATLTASATITMGPSDEAGASFEAAGLTIAAVESDGEALAWEIGDDGRVDVGLGPSHGEATLRIDYQLAVQNEFNGLLPGGSTLVWPYHCGNLFPCRSAPSEGSLFSLAVHDVPPGLSAIHPERIVTETASYVPAWATGDYQVMELGTTASGVALAVWYLPGGEAAAASGTADLVRHFEHLENLLGPYAFGERAGSIAVRWGPGALGGMEHHPLWHVAEGAMGDASVHAHEAAHGWYGDGVRIACWEDFVLSEGTVSYLAARAIEAVGGPAQANALWSGYQARLAAAMSSSAMKIAWPDSCGAVDILDHQLFSSIPYMKGAFFFRALEQRIGAATLDQALAGFYQERVGTAARMQELLDHIQAASGYDPSACAEAWLRSETVPSEPACP